MPLLPETQRLTHVSEPTPQHRLTNHSAEVERLAQEHKAPGIHEGNNNNLLHDRKQANNLQGIIAICKMKAAPVKTQQQRKKRSKQGKARAPLPRPQQNPQGLPVTLAY
jgi:hypothetical protein